MITKLSSKKEQQKKQKRNQWIVGAILIFVLMFSAFGVAVNSFGEDKKSNKLKYNGYEFINENNLWYLELGELIFMFVNSPLETEDLATVSNINLINTYVGKPLYLSSEESRATYEIYQNLEYFPERIQLACLDESTCQGDLPIKTCEDNFIIIKISNNTKIEQQENCVFIEGKQEDLTKLTDEFLYYAFGIK